MGRLTDFIDVTWARRAAVALLLIIFFAQGAHIAANKSNTFDEPAHILNGYAYLSEGIDFLAPLHHPIPGRAITSLPLAFIDLDLVASTPSEEEDNSAFHRYSVKFIFENTVTGEKILLLSRLSVLTLALLLGGVLYLWSSELWGRAGGLFSLFLFALSPNILAHSSLATTDLPITTFFFISAYCLWLTLRRDTHWQLAAVTGIAVGFAFATKHTAFLLLPLVAITVFMKIGRGEGWKRTATHYTVVAAVAYVTLWALYGFHYHSPSPEYGGLPWEKFTGSPLAPLFDLMRSVTFLPESYIYSLAGTFGSASSGKPAFLMGEYSLTGWWYYFILAFLIKTPEATIFFLIAALCFMVASKDRSQLGEAAFILFMPLLLLVVISSQKVNIGLRHLLPAYPFLFVFLGYLPTIGRKAVRYGRYGFVFFCFWYAASAAMIHPNQLAFFNGFIGGPKNGYKYLVDSNLDWGQDLPALKRYMDENAIDSVKIAYFGLSDPRYYGIEYEWLPSYVIFDHMKSPELGGGRFFIDGYVAISATMLQGVYLADRVLYRVFRELRPVARLGYSIFVYRIEPTGGRDGKGRE